MTERELWWFNRWQLPINGSIEFATWARRLISSSRDDSMYERILIANQTACKTFADVFRRDSINFVGFVMLGYKLARNWKGHKCAANDEERSILETVITLQRRVVRRSTWSHFKEQSLCFERFKICFLKDSLRTVKNCFSWLKLPWSQRMKFLHLKNYRNKDFQNRDFAL